MANLKDLVEARKLLLDTNLSYNRVLIYGNAKVGKTYLAATVAKIPSIKRIFWIDTENGSATLLNPELGLTDAQMAKVEIINLPDTKAHPIAIETIRKLLNCHNDVTVCEAHGKVACVPCKKDGLEVIDFPAIATLGATDCIVIDSLSQTGDSAFEVAKRMTEGDKSAFAKYGMQGDLLSELMSSIQQLRTNIICLTHAQLSEDVSSKKDTVVPLCGTRNFSLKTAKYFNSVIYLTMEMKKFKAGSTPTYKVNVVSGDRRGVKVEDMAVVDMEAIFNG